MYKQTIHPYSQTIQEQSHDSISHPLLYSHTIPESKNFLYTQTAKKQKLIIQRLAR